MQLQHRSTGPLARARCGAALQTGTGLVRNPPATLRIKPFVACQASQPQQSAAANRRQLLLGSGSLLLGGTLSQLLFAQATNAAVPNGFKELSDPILAYSFIYPEETASGKPLNMIMSRAPEKYSSAAPLAADARQRIVSEVIDPRNTVVVSMTVGPAVGLLAGKPPSEWKPRDVAFQVLADRSTSRLSTGQRTSLNDIEELQLQERDGQQYIVFEHLSQGSPTVVNIRKETFRHALAVTAWRPAMDGTPFLYTLNVACRQEFWDDLEPQFKAAIDSFRLLQTTDAYIPPDKDPWLFF